MVEKNRYLGFTLEAEPLLLNQATQAKAAFESAVQEDGEF